MIILTLLKEINLNRQTWRELTCTGKIMTQFIGQICAEDSQLLTPPVNKRGFVEVRRGRAISCQNKQVECQVYFSLMQLLLQVSQS